MEQKLLNQICWSFSNKKYEDLEQFNKKVAKYNHEIMANENVWDAEKIVVFSEKIDIYYTAWITGPEDILPNEELCEDEDFFEDEDNSDGEHFQAEIKMSLDANNKKYFLAGELLFKIHNQFANKELGDHTFFEGLSVLEGGNLNKFYIHFGS